MQTPGSLRLAGAVVLAAAFAPALAFAQVAGAGAASAVLGGAEKPFTFGVQETTAYESNPARGNAADAALRGLRGDDVTLSPSVTATYSHGAGLYGVALNGLFGYAFHTRNSSLSSEHLSLSIVGNAAVGSLCSAGGSARYDRGQSDLQYLTIDVTKNVTQTYLVNGSETCSTPTGLTENVQVFRSSTQNASSELSNYNTTGVSGLIGYSKPVIGTVGLTVSYNETSYDNGGSKSAALRAVTAPELRVTSVGVQISRPIGARLSGSASVSYSHSTQGAAPGLLNAQRSSYDGLTTAIGLNYLVGPRLQLSTHVSRGLSGSSFRDVGYALVTQVDGQAVYKVSQRITATLGGSWGHTDYQGRLAYLVPFTPGWQENTSVYGQASFRIGSRSAASLEIRHSTGEADLSLYNYSSNYLGLTLSTTF